jgi:hypothetical protein
MTDDIEYRRTRSGSLSDPLTPRLAAGLLADVAAGRPGLVAVRHPLGFLCFPLVRRPEVGICVHLWTGSAPVVRTSAVHSHSWDLTSVVLYGEVRNSVVPVFDTEARPTHRVFEVHSSGDRDEVRGTGRLVRAAGATTTVSAPGDTYELLAGVFHRTDVTPSEDTATLIRARTRAALIDLSLGAVDTPSHSLVRRQCTVRETVRAARSVTVRLAAAGR